MKTTKVINYIKTFESTKCCYLEVWNDIMWV